MIGNHLVLSSLIIFVSSQSVTPPGGYYHTKYDHLDVEDVLNHKRLVHHYANCLLSRGPCPPEGADLKRILPEALETTCLRCTEKQKIVVLNTVRRLRKEYPSIWKEVADLWDPTGEYVKKFEEAFKNTILVSSTTTTFSPNAIDPLPNLLTNRFGEEDSANNLVPTNQRPYPSSTSSSGTKRPSSTTAIRPPSTTRPSSTTSRPSSTSSRPLPTPQPPSGLAPPSVRPPFRWWLTTTNGLPPVSNWRPTTQFFRPQQTARPVLPILNVDGVRILGSIGDIGSKLLQAGTQAAGMVLSTVQALVGH